MAGPYHSTPCFRTVRTASHRARTGLALPRTMRTVRHSRTTPTGAYEGTVRCECVCGASNGKHGVL